MSFPSETGSPTCFSGARFRLSRIALGMANITDPPTVRSLARCIASPTVISQYNIVAQQCQYARRSWTVLASRAEFPVRAVVIHPWKPPARWNGASQDGGRLERRRRTYAEHREDA